jgi:hypothetical protein
VGINSKGKPGRSYDYCHMSLHYSSLFIFRFDCFYIMIDVKFIHGDCLEIMPTLTDKSIDMILCDLPIA